VDHPRHQLLAGARVAGDVHRGLRAGHLGDHLPQLLHGFRVAEQCEPRASLRVLVGLPPELQRRRDQPAQRGEIERLRDEVEGAELQCPHGGLDVAVRGDDGHWHAGPVGLDPLDEVETVTVGQPHVGEHEVEPFAAELLHGAGVVRGSAHLDLHPAERDTKQVADVRLVVDDEGARCHGRGQGTRFGVPLMFNRLYRRRARET